MYVTENMHKRDRPKKAQERDASENIVHLHCLAQGEPGDTSLLLDDKSCAEGSGCECCLD